MSNGKVARGFNKCVANTVIGLDVYDQVLTGDGAKCLKANRADADSTPCVLVAYGLDAYNQTVSEEVICPLRAHDGGDTTPKVVIMEGNGSRPSHRGDGYRESDIMYTLNSTEVHAVAYGEESVKIYGFDPYNQVISEQLSPTIKSSQAISNSGGGVIITKHDEGRNDNADRETVL